VRIALLADIHSNAIALDAVLADSGVRGGAGADLIVGGHSHRPVDRTFNGVRYVNPGAVSNAAGDAIIPLACMTLAILRRRREEERLLMAAFGDAGAGIGNRPGFCAAGDRHGVGKATSGTCWNC
jgi:predicted phosphodiesterase